jgi:hypothetical protein
LKKIIFMTVAMLTFATVAVTNADTIYIGTGIPVTSKNHENGANVSETITDSDKNGLADGREGSSWKAYGDVTNTRDKNWSVLYADIGIGGYKDWFAGKNNTVTTQVAAVAKALENQGQKAFGYVDYYKLNGVFESSADLYGNIGMNGGGLSDFAVGDAGVITTYGGAHFEERGSYRYNEDGSIELLGKTSPATGFVGVQSGIVAFTTGFEMATGFDYINGAFSVMGELMGIYLNGTLLNSDLYYLSDNLINSDYDYVGQYNLEIDLTNEFIASLLGTGNNNLSFMVLGIPHSLSGIASDTDMSFIALSAGLSQNTESITNPPPPDNPTTPEPAAMLIFGIGLAGLGLRQLSKKIKRGQKV